MIGEFILLADSSIGFAPAERDVHSNERLVKRIHN
jgi:hypothetical protein